MSNNWYEDFLIEAEKMQSCELKKYICSCPVEASQQDALFFCKYLTIVQRNELMYQSGVGYHKKWVERELCSWKWMKAMGLTDKPQERLQTEAGGIEDTFGEGGFI